jgi:hypothetical protein
MMIFPGYSEQNPVITNKIWLKKPKLSCFKQKKSVKTKNVSVHKTEAKNILIKIR